MLLHRHHHWRLHRHSPLIYLGCCLSQSGGFFLFLISFYFVVIGLIIDMTFVLQNHLKILRNICIYLILLTVLNIIVIAIIVILGMKWLLNEHLTHHRNHWRKHHRHLVLNWNLEKLLWLWRWQWRCSSRDLLLWRFCSNFRLLGKTSRLWLNLRLNYNWLLSIILVK